MEPDALICVCKRGDIGSRFLPAFLSAATQIALHRLPEGGAMNVWSNEKYCDLANLILGAVLFFSPWIFGFAAGHQSQNAWVTGAVIAILSIAALAAFAVWEEWLNFVARLWSIVSRWVVVFHGTTA